jgi:hydrogenase expression/formation protein HypC
MCLSIPSKVVKLEEDNMVVVDTMGVTRRVSLDMLDGETKLGDYLLIHVGFAIGRIDEEDALASLAVYQEILEKLDEEERKERILADDACENR